MVSGLRFVFVLLGLLSCVPAAHAKGEAFEVSIQTTTPDGEKKFAAIVAGKQKSSMELRAGPGGKDLRVSLSVARRVSAKTGQPADTVSVDVQIFERTDAGWLLLAEPTIATAFNQPASMSVSDSAGNGVTFSLHIQSVAPQMLAQRCAAIPGRALTSSGVAGLMDKLARAEQPQAAPNCCSDACDNRSGWTLKCCDVLCCSEAVCGTSCCTDEV